MPVVFWYIGLGLIGSLVSIYTIIKKRDIYKISTLIVFYLLMAGFTWICEFLVLGMFNAYAYKIGVFTNIWAQNLLGHLILNTTLYPAAAIVMMAYKLQYVWIFGIALIFTMIEYIFIHLGIYVQHWWKYYMTFGTLVIFLTLAYKWFPKIQKGCQGATRVVTYYFVALIIVHTPAPILLLYGKQHYHIDFVEQLFSDAFLSSIVIIFFYHLIEALILVIITCVLKKWYFKVVPFIISISVQSFLVKINVLTIRDDWNLLFTLLIYEIFIAAFILLEKFTLKPRIQ